MTQQDNTKPYPPAEGREGPGQIETTRARQGEAPGHVRYVLLVSVALVVVAFAIIYFANIRF
jgi:hypothetical protein